MARLSHQEQAARLSVEIMADAIDRVQAVLAWSDTERDIAAQSFDKSRQARLAKLNGELAGLSVDLWRLNMTIEAARRGEFVER
jgi:hypothetical protein